MSNRHERRAAAALPKVPNISGTSEACENCIFSSKRQGMEKVVSVHGQNELKQGRPAPQMLPEDENFCFRYPNQQVKKTWGWCGEYQAMKP